MRLFMLAALGSAFVIGCDGWFYHPSRTVWLRPEQLRLKFEDVRFRTRDDIELHGWYFPAEEGARPPRGSVIHFHGNAENISNHLPLVEWLPRAGFHLLMFDYRGYGQSAGSPTRAGTIADGHAALDHLLSQPETDASRVFGYGQSLGGAVALIVAAERREIRALVVESSFGSYRGIAKRHLRGKFGSWMAGGLANALVSRGHDPIDVVAKISPRPIFFISAGEDAICFAELNQELFDRAGEPKQLWLVPRAEHLGILEEAPNELPARIVEFFDAIQ